MPKSESIEMIAKSDIAQNAALEYDHDKEGSDGGVGGMNTEFAQLKNKVGNMGEAVRLLRTDMKEIKLDLAIVKNNTGWLKWGLGIVITVMLALGGGLGGYMTYLLSQIVNK